MAEETKIPKPRMTFLDSMKGFGIIFVVLWHSFCPFAHVFSTFLLAMFFMISGFCWNEKHTQDWKSVITLIKKRFRELLLPYLISEAIFLSLQYVFLSLHMLPDMFAYPPSDIPMVIVCMLLGLGGSPFLGTLWYFYVFFMVCVLHAVVCRLAKKFIQTARSRLIFYIILITVTALLLWGLKTLNDSMGIRFFASYLAFILGVPARMIYNRLKPEGHPVICAVLFAVIITAITLTNNIMDADLASGNVTSIILYMLYGCAGFVCIMCLSLLLETGKTANLRRGISYLGRNTKPIMILHLLCFVPVKLVYILITGLPMTELEQFPVIINDDLSYMWLIYTVTGITLSLLLNKLYLTIKSHIPKKKKQA